MRIQGPPSWPPSPGSSVSAGGAGVSGPRGERSGGVKFAAKAAFAVVGLVAVPALGVGGWAGAVAVALAVSVLVALAAVQRWITGAEVAVLLCAASLSFLAGALAFLPYSVQVEGPGTTVQCQDPMTVQGDLGDKEERTAAEKACYSKAQSRLTSASFPGLILILVAMWGFVGGE